MYQVAAADPIVGHALLAGGVGVGVRHHLCVAALVCCSCLTFMCRVGGCLAWLLPLYALWAASLGCRACKSCTARLIVFLGCRVRALRSLGSVKAVIKPLIMMLVSYRTLAA